MNKKLKNDILKALNSKSYVFERNELNKVLQEKYGHERKVEGHLDISSSEVMHLIDVLEGEGLVKKQTGSTGGGVHAIFYSLTTKGYETQDPWYKQLFRYFRRNIEQTLVTIVVTTIMTLILHWLGV